MLHSFCNVQMLLYHCACIYLYHCACIFSFHCAYILYTKVWKLMLEYLTKLNIRGIFFFSIDLYECSSVCTG